jgi:hypothetical protein
MNKVLIRAGEPAHSAEVDEPAAPPVRIRTECPIGEPNCQL